MFAEKWVKATSNSCCRCCQRCRCPNVKYIVVFIRCSASCYSAPQGCGMVKRQCCTTILKCIVLDLRSYLPTNTIHRKEFREKKSEIKSFILLINKRLAGIRTHSQSPSHFILNIPINRTDTASKRMWWWCSVAKGNEGNNS